jgi:hypothetical protein
VIVKLHESNNPWKKSIEKQSTSKTKWGRQNPRVVSCQTLNIKKYWIEWKNQKEKSNLQKNPKHKEIKKSILNELNDDWWNF